MTRSFESNGPDVKIRGTAQHVAEKYLQLARDAQSSGDIVMAENLLQHAEHYFRLISAAQQQTNGYGRQSYETDVDYEEDDDFSAIPDRFAPLSERLPPGPGAYQAPQPAFQPPQPQAQPQPQPHFIQPQPQPQPFEERPFEPRHERPVRSERPPFGGRGRSHERSVVDRHQDADASEGGDRASHFGFDRSRERGRFPPRREPPAAPVEQPPAPEPMSSAVGLPAFITAPPTISVTRAAPPEVEAPPAPQAEAPSNEQPGRGGYHLAPRRRRKPRAQASEGADESPASSELPLGD